MLQRYNFFLINKYKNELKSSFLLYFVRKTHEKSRLRRLFIVVSF